MNTKLNGWFLIKAVVTVGFVALLVKECDGVMKDARKDQAQYELEKQPRVIRVVDGRKVYAFRDGGMHYFTRCDGTTTTDQSYEECRQMGKSRTCENKTERIITETTKGITQ